jgi:hypothetical protein
MICEFFVCTWALAWARARREVVAVFFPFQLCYWTGNNILAVMHTLEVLWEVSTHQLTSSYLCL